jgi:DNA-binding NarL/FixJ family response regulator
LYVRFINLKTNLTALIADHNQNIDKYLKVCKEIGVTHWIHLLTGNQIRSHFRKYGPPKVALISERIGGEYGINLAQELKNASCDNIVLFMSKKDPVRTKQIISKKTRALIFKSENPIQTPNWKLTSKEFKLIQLLANGKDVTQISESLKLPVSRVKSILANIRKKTGIHDRAALVTTALRAGVIG